MLLGVGSFRVLGGVVRIFVRLHVVVCGVGPEPACFCLKTVRFGFVCVAGGVFVLLMLHVVELVLRPVHAPPMQGCCVFVLGCLGVAAFQLSFVGMLKRSGTRIVVMRVLLLHCLLGVVRMVPARGFVKRRAIVSVIVLVRHSHRLVVF